MSDSSSEEELTFSPERNPVPAAAANEDDDDAPDPPFMKQVIPKKKKDKKKKKKDKKKKKKRKKEHKKEKHDDESADESHHGNVADQHSEDDTSHAASHQDGDEMEVSLNDLKRKVMGRDLKTEEDSDREQDKELQEISALTNAEHEQEDSKAKNDKKIYTIANSSMSEKLRRDLMCSICHEVVYPPVSLLCGHSFCQTCLEWWFDRSRADPSCPTCRKTVPVDRHDAISHNFALKSCVMAVYGAEIVERLKSQRPKGERGGRHDQGYEVLSILEDETWHYVKVTTDKGVTDKSMVTSDTVQVRRSIVLDAEDQRMQLALSVYRRPERVVVDEQKAFRVQLCLLHMEEDEAADSGFPSTVENEEDEMLLCGRENRFLHTYMEVKMKGENGRTSPLARIPSDDVGLFTYVLDPSMSTGNPAEARALIFEHTDTGCRLEIDLAQLQSRGGSTLRPKQNPSQDFHGDDADSESSYSNGRRRGFVMGEGDDSDERDGDDEFEDDGFLVDDQNQGSDIEGEFSGEEDDNDVCQICKEHGNLMICDGGDEDDGCGKSFHAACVNREVVPEGDWICQECATSHGIITGIEGHEFKAEPLFGASVGGRPRVLDDDSEDESEAEFKAKAEAINNEPKKKKRRVLEDSDSD
jgi:hypothetical protein